MVKLLCLLILLTSISCGKRSSEKAKAMEPQVERTGHDTLEAAKLNLRSAVEAGKKADVEKILSDFSLSVNQIYDDKETLLHIAIRRGHEEVRDLLILKGAKLEATNKDGETPIMTAARYEREDTAEILLEKRVNLNNQDSVTGNTALHWALNAPKPTENSIHIAMILIEANADTQRANKIGETVCSISLKKDIQVIINRLNCQLPGNGSGGNSDNGDNQYAQDLMSLINALKEAKVEEVQKLLTKNPKLAQDTKETLVIHALSIKDYKMAIKALTLLLENGADPDILDSNAQSPLMYAVKNKNYDQVKLLMDKGAESTYEISGKTACTVAWQVLPGGWLSKNRKIRNNILFALRYCDL